MGAKELIHIDKGGEEVKVISATDDHVLLLIYVRDVERNWHELKVKVPREKFKEVGYHAKGGG